MSPGGLEFYTPLIFRNPFHFRGSKRNPKTTKSHTTHEKPLVKKYNPKEKTKN